MTNRTAHLPVIDVLCDAGFLPADLVDGRPSWMTGKWEPTGLRVLSTGNLLQADHRADQLVLSLTTNKGVILAEIKVTVDDDDELAPLEAAAFIAVSAAWSAS